MEETRTEFFFSDLKYSGWQKLLIFLAALLSMVEKVNICGFELTGKYFIYVAGLFLLLPIIMLILSRGGYFKFGNLELKLDAIEKFAVADLQRKIDEIRVEFDEYRAKHVMIDQSFREEITPDVGHHFEEKKLSEVLEVDKNDFKEAIQEYKQYKDGKLWEKRNNVDLKLLRLSPRLNFKFLDEVYSASTSDKETLMAVAVCLGYTNEKNSEEDAFCLLETLIKSKYAWVRKRVIRSIEWRLNRSETSKLTKEKLIDLLESQLEKEINKESNEEVEKLLKTVLSKV